MSKHTLTIELAKPLEWVRVEKSDDLLGFPNLRCYAIRKDGREWVGYLNRVSSIGLAQFTTIKENRERGPTGHFPFEVALIETPPWPIVHKDKDGWIDLEKTPEELLESRVHELRGKWGHRAWGFWRKSRKQWGSPCGNIMELRKPYCRPSRARPVESWPASWDYGPPSNPKQPEPETVEQRLARLEAWREKVCQAAGKGGGE